VKSIDRKSFPAAMVDVEMEGLPWVSVFAAALASDSAAAEHLNKNARWIETDQVAGVNNHSGSCSSVAGYLALAPSCCHRTCQEGPPQH